MINEIKKNKTTALLVIVGVLTGLLAGCWNSGSGASDTSAQKPNIETPKDTATGAAEQPGPNEVQIVIENFAFVPSEITITAGTRVTWINKDEAPHTATSTDKKFNSGGLDTDDKYSFVFNDKGEFPYFCALHPHMTASITVN